MSSAHADSLSQPLHGRGRAAGGPAAADQLPSWIVTAKTVRDIKGIAMWGMAALVAGLGLGILFEAMRRIDTLSTSAAQEPLRDALIFVAFVAIALGLVLGYSLTYRAGSQARIKPGRAYGLIPTGEDGTPASRRVGRDRRMSLVSGRGIASGRPLRALDVTA